MEPACSSRERETFHKFFECWLAEQNQHLQDLISASKNHIAESDQTVLRPLVQRVVQHYEQYYTAKSSYAQQDALSMFSPSWLSSLEDAFLWIGGWRPTMAFHLLYSKSGLQFEERLADLICGLSTGDLGDLSAHQLHQVDEVQRNILKEERDLSEKMAKQHETVADPSMVELAHVITELKSNGDADGEVDEERVESTLESKEEGLREILEKADDLRLRTLEGVIEILTPIQVVHFLIAAAELHLRIHEWGKVKDAKLSVGTSRVVDPVGRENKV